MTRTQLACYSLLISAILLTGMLLVQLGERSAAGDPSPAQALSQLLEQRAHGEMVVAGEGFTLMTARTSDDEESLFLLHNQTGRLLIYTLDFPGGRINLVGGDNMQQVFARR